MEYILLGALINGLLRVYAYMFHVCGLSGCAPTFAGSALLNRPCGEPQVPSVEKVAARLGIP
jgi:hypothetical protein